jgi:hypothetical protein
MGLSTGGVGGGGGGGVLNDYKNQHSPILDVTTPSTCNSCIVIGYNAGGPGSLNVGGLQRLGGGNLLLAGLQVPFQTLPQDPNESPGDGWIRNGRNGWNPQTGQSLSPDFSHLPPKGPHYDLHSRYPKGKLSIRPNGPGIDFWGPDMSLPEGWLPLELLPLE